VADTELPILRFLVVLMRVRGVVLFGALSLLAGGAAAQSSRAAGLNEVISTGAMPNAVVATPVMNQPFSGIWNNEMVQTLADGTKVSRHGHHLIARDLQGRVRVEQRISKAAEGKPEIKLVFVSDPQAHTLTTWAVGSPGPHTASVIKVPSEPRVKTAAVKECADCAVKVSSRPEPVITTTDLGTQMIGTVPAAGKLITTIVPPGRSGNDKPITKTHEIWTSDELKLVVKQHWTDPREGERSVEIDHLSRKEPDAELFRVPAGYQVKSALETLKEVMARLEATQQ
jgi:hypothetical protein